MTSKVNYKGGFRTSAEHAASGSIIMTDAPKDNNGKGELFSPTDLVATALASCMITVMGIKAKHTNIPFDDVSAKVNKVMESSPRRIADVIVDVYIGEEWDENQKKLMETIGRTCPVAKSLHPDLKQIMTFIYQSDRE